ncbi:DNA polymerase A exonuclease, putative [Bodo saltans]|uniref:3'-5' exonuclease n=1 Tax=Bodo saltans TaxID=75058 RepID=A0A0S4IQD0_BODSA|nr:DNA polymerase A exonuclease, putative [Bodo saltans]|eukprot:CUF95001.1 DNA polymerase A exonuclease, putative [Bodo saltans]
MKICTNTNMQCIGHGGRKLMKREPYTAQHTNPHTSTSRQLKSIIVILIMMSARFQVPVHIVDSPLTWSNHVLPHWQSFVEATLALPHSSSSRSNLPIVGLDAEWVRKRPMAVLQVGSMHGCFLFQMQRCAGPPADSAAIIQQWLPDEVVSFLKSGDVVMCGVNISGDLRRLEREQGIVVTQHMELDHVALLLRQGDVGGGQLSLGALSERILGVPLGKDINVTLSDWEADALSPQQVQYAADDAIASALIACELYRHYTASVEAEKGLVEDIRTWVERIREPAMVAFKLAHKAFSKSQGRVLEVEFLRSAPKQRRVTRRDNESQEFQNLEATMESSVHVDDNEPAAAAAVKTTSSARKHRGVLPTYAETVFSKASQEGPIWVFQNGKAIVAYDAAAQLTIEEAFTSRLPAVMIHTNRLLDGNECAYEIDFEKMSQRNTKTNFRRRVIRLTE